MESLNEAQQHIIELGRKAADFDMNAMFEAMKNATPDQMIVVDSVPQGFSEAKNTNFNNRGLKLSHLRDVIRNKRFPMSNEAYKCFYKFAFGELSDKFEWFDTMPAKFDTYAIQYDRLMFGVRK